MKKNLRLLILPILLGMVLVGCKKDNEPDPNATYDVMVQLVYPNDVTPVEGVKLSMTNSQGTALEAMTDADGLAEFKAVVGLYTVTASDQRAADGQVSLFNGTSSEIQVTHQWDKTKVTELSLTETKAGQIVIKEFYFGGCQDNTGEGKYSFDSYVTLYNNSDMEADISNLCLGTSLGNAHAMDVYGLVDSDGTLVYANETWTPAWNSVYQSKGAVSIPARSQIVIAIAGGINHTVTYTNSVNLSNADYVIYDPEVLTNQFYHPVPSASISSDNYIGASMFGMGNAVMIGTVCPSLFIYQLPDDMNADTFISDASNLGFVGKFQMDAFKIAKIQKEWILDATEAFNANFVEKSKKRLTSDLDAGQAIITTSQGYTMYRNVDKEATEAIEGNKDKLVYGYSLGTVGLVDSGTTDPSGIDAEASIKAGAVIVYKDTNNSTADFHQRKISALK